MLFFCPIWYPPDLSNFCSTRSCLIIAPPPLDEKLLVFTRGVNYQEPQKYFFGTKIPKYFFFSNFFLKYFFLFFFKICFFTEEVSHFLGQKTQKHFFFLKKYFPKFFLHKNIFFQFFFLLKKLVTFWDKKLKKIFFL